jgi:hypothetical protein
MMRINGTEMTKKAAVLYNVVFFVAAIPCIVLFWYFRSHYYYRSLGWGERILTLIGYARFVLCPVILVIGIALVGYYSTIASSSDSRIIKLCIVVLLSVMVAIMFFNTLYTFFFEIVYMVEHF